MTSQLASQLKRLQQRPVEDKRLAQSFLFSSAEARTFSREQIHQLAVHGMQTLVAMDNRFHPFIELLFHPHKTRVERKLLSTSANEAHDVALEQFLTLLSPHMFLTAAHQVFEYLVRVHEVHVYNVDAVLRTFLPYHDHSIFARALMLLDLRDTGFSFLEKNQENGAPLLRENLVMACTRSRKALRLVCLMLAAAVRMKVHNSAANALFTGVAVQLASDPDAEALWRVLLPFIMEFLSGTHAGVEGAAVQEEAKEGELNLWIQEDLRNSNGPSHPLLPSREVVCSALVVLAAWSNEVQLSVATLATVVKPIIRFLTGASGPAASSIVPTDDLLALLNFLFHTQRGTVAQVTFTPQIQLLLALPWKQWTSWIDAAGMGMYDTLITVLMRHCTQRLQIARSLESVAPEVLHFLHCAIEDLPLSDTLVAEVIQTLMTCYAEKTAVNSNDNKKRSSIAVDVDAKSNDSKEEKRLPVTRWMQALERRFSHVFDLTLSRLLNDPAMQGEATAFLAQHLSGTRYELLEVRGLSGASERLPLFACLLHPLPEVRLLAAKAMYTMTVQQLTASSSAPSGTGRGNSLLELLEHVLQYEQSAQVALQFLHTSEAAAQKLLLWFLGANGGTEDEEVVEAGNTKSFIGQRDIALLHLRGILRSLWKMITHHGIHIQKSFFDIVLLPLMRRVESHHSAPRMNDMQKGAALNGSRAASPVDEAMKVLVYYLTLLYVSATYHRQRGRGKEEKGNGVTTSGQSNNSTARVGAGEEARFSELIVGLEQLLRGVAPEMGRSASFFSLPADNVLLGAAEDEKASNDERPNKRKRKSEVLSTQVSLAGGVGSECLFVFGCPSLLQRLRDEASNRLPATLSQLRGGVAGDDVSDESRTTMLECCLASAALLSTSSNADVDAVIHMLLQFFVGEDEVKATKAPADMDKSYLGAVQEAQRAASRHANEKVGRGAKSNLAAPFLPQDEFTAAMGATVHCSIVVRLMNDTHNNTEVLLRMGRLLGFLSTPLPAVATNLSRLPPVYMRLLRQDDDNNGREEVGSCFPVDWFDLVFTAVFRTLCSFTTTEAAALEDKQPFPLSALSLILLCPLTAPTCRREDVLQELQNLILAATTGKHTTIKKKISKKKNTTTVTATTGASMIIEAAIQDENISITTLSCFVEVLAREESKGNLTRDAAELLCRMTADDKCGGLTGEPAIPFTLLTRIIEQFFPLGGSSISNANRKVCSASTGSGIVIRILLPLLRNILKIGGDGVGMVSHAAAEFLRAVCLRAGMKGTSGDEEDACLQLCSELLRYPFLRVADDRVRAVYRYALTNIAVTLSHGLQVQQASTVLIISRDKKGTTSSQGFTRDENCGLDNEESLRCVATTISHVLLDNRTCMNRLGSDAVRLLVGTLGGYHRLFLPWVAQLLQQPNPDLSLVVDAVESLAAPTKTKTSSSSTEAGTAMEDAWEPPSGCVLHNPLTFTDVESLLKLCAKSFDAQNCLWPRRESTLLALRLLCGVITVSPSFRFDSDEDDEEVSLFDLIDRLLASFPLGALLPLLAEAENGTPRGGEVEDEDKNGMNGIGTGLMPFRPQALAYLRSVIDLCIFSSHALNEGQSNGASRICRIVVKQCVVLMAALLLPSNATAMTETTQLSCYRIETISELLRIVSPLFSASASKSGDVGSGDAELQAGGQTALHIPLVGLLIRLETVNFSSLGHSCESAVDMCIDLLVSFDMHTQLACLSQMMRLLINPHEQLSVSAEQETRTTTRVTRPKAKEHDGSESSAVVKLFRKMVKPNQVINRQGVILQLINTTVKSEPFLRGFLELQHKRTSRPLRAKQDGVDDDEAEEPTEVRTNDECMALLVSSLELFAHYAMLNLETENDAVPVAEAAEGDNNKRDDTPEFGEKKAFVMLLELLAGNTLACVLAGINEVTFVACMERLLSDPRMELKRKGLEVLLDRLHHALPTVEHTLTDAEVEEHRRRLRDPKCKLTLMDLVRVKARPLVTKRSFALFSHLSEVIHVIVKGATASATGGALVNMLPLSVGCMEELIRIIGSGGSLQAEKTLLNVHRADRVTEATLSKLFGKKSRVQEVHQWVDDILSMVPRLLQLYLDRYRRNPTTASLAGELEVKSKDEKDGTLLAVAALLTALGTVCQVMGTVFSVRHSNAILQTVTWAMVFAVGHVAPIVSRSNLGSLLRQASLGCLLRVFPSCWLMCQPYLPRIIISATHLHNVDDTETNYRSAETMAMLEALLEPQLFIGACTECLHGATTGSPDAPPTKRRGEGAKNTIRIRVDTHSFTMLYESVQRRVATLKREELRQLSLLVEGTSAQDNFWLASMQALASAPAFPSRDVLQPVLEAYTVFFLKFKAKHCTRYLSTVAEWAFGATADHFLKREQQHGKDAAAVPDDDNDHHGRDDAATVPRMTLHSWLLFYVLSNHLLEKLGSIMDFAFPVMLPYVAGTLTSYCSSSSQHVMKHGTELIALTLEGALDSVRRMAISQTASPDHDYSVPVDNYLALPEVFSSVMPAVVRQLENLVYLTDSTHNYAFRAEHHVIPAVRALFRSLTSSKLQSKMQNELLRTLRHPSRHVRHMGLLCFDGIYADGGDELAARLMAEMLPAVVEMTEDRDDAVVEQARKLCINLSAITGQDVLYAMST